MKKNALIVFGGWEGHQPGQVASVFRRVLETEGFEVEMSATLDAFNDPARLMRFDLIVPHWTMGKLTPEQTTGVLTAVQNGVGLAGCHGGVCDAFRDNPDWHFMTGGQFVSHPGGNVKYAVHIKDTANALVTGIKDFEVASEQYYLHVDPAVHVLATTRFPVAPGPHAANGPVEMPVAWTKFWGQGRVYYNSLGHDAATVSLPPILKMMRRGFNWAAR